MDISKNLIAKEFIKLEENTNIRNQKIEQNNISKNLKKHY